MMYLMYLILSAGGGSVSVYTGSVNGESLHVQIQEHLSSCFSFQLTTDL